MKYKGELFGISSLLLWGLYPIITIFTYKYVNFMYSLAFSSLFSILFFLFFFIKNKEWKYFHKKSGWLPLIGAGILNGIVFYIITGYGLRFTDSINSSILGLSEIFFSYLLFGILFTHKKSPLNEIIGSIFLIVGVGIFLFPGKINLHFGDIFILIGTLISPIGNYLVGRALKNGFSSNFLMLIRASMATTFLFTYCYFSFEIPKTGDILAALPYLVFSGIVLFGLSKYLFTGALHTVPVARLSSFIVLYPLSAIIYTIIFFGKYPKPEQIIGCIPLVLGVLIFFNIIKIPKSKLKQAGI